MTSENPDTERSQVAEEILAYFVEHPRAQDTLEGVMNWWLLKRRIMNEIDKVKTALAELVARGFIVELEGAGSRVRYALNRRRLAEIHDLIEEESRVAGRDQEDSSTES